MRGTLTNFVVLVVLLWLGHAGLAVAQTDPLPSWREGPAKAAILDFVARTTTTVQTT